MPFYPSSSRRFSGNTSTNPGGGMHNVGGASPFVANTGFCDNLPDQIDGPFFNGTGISMLYCPPPIPTPDTCPADISEDGSVNVTDLLILLGAWGVCP